LIVVMNAYVLQLCDVIVVRWLMMDVVMTGDHGIGHFVSSLFIIKQVDS